MGKNKLQRFAELKTFNNVIEATGPEWFKKEHDIKGNWAGRIFGNNHPIILELGCGKGEYTVGLAKKFPEKNFIGIDIKGARMWRGAKTSVEEEMTNVAFLRTRINFINAFFGPDEVSEIWLTFSDPQPLRWRKRLTSPIFMEMYKKFLVKGGIVHVKTDSILFYDYTLEEIQRNGYKLIFATNDLYGVSIGDFDVDTREILEIKTHYEAIFLKQGKQICYLKFQI